MCVTFSFKQFFVGLVVSISLCIRCLPRCLPAHCLVSPSSNLVSYVSLSSFTPEETEAERHLVTCPPSRIATHRDQPTPLRCLPIVLSSRSLAALSSVRTTHSVITPTAVISKVAGSQDLNLGPGFQSFQDPELLHYECGTPSDLCEDVKIPLNFLE